MRKGRGAGTTGARGALAPLGLKVGGPGYPLAPLDMSAGKRAKRGPTHILAPLHSAEAKILKGQSPYKPLSHPISFQNSINCIKSSSCFAKFSWGKPQDPNLIILSSYLRLLCL